MILEINSNDYYKYVDTPQTRFLLKILWRGYMDWLDKQQKKLINSQLTFENNCIVTFLISEWSNLIGHMWCAILCTLSIYFIIHYI